MVPTRQSPLFLKSYEMLVWLLRHTSKFPKNQRFVMAKRMEEAALDFHDALLASARTRQPRRLLSGLHQADIYLERLKVYNRLASDLKLHALDQYAHLAERLDELGRLLGGWIRAVNEPRSAQAGRGARG